MKSDEQPRPQQLDFVFPSTPMLVVLGRDSALEATAREILTAVNAAELASEVRVEWNARLFSAAGRADSRRNLVSLNPRLRDHDAAEIERTLRHELAHLLAQFRARRRRISPHGAEWRKACRDLGIADEARCHTLPFPVRQRVRRFLYRCSRCGKDFPRVRRIKRKVACLDCCRKFNRGKFDPTARLRLVEDPK
ncbi:MAG TPA: SprT-like domain-containing protein [Chthoniobacterales bacterium]|nr:SprT-like domain-containing protein [Chthoniobacterales bacterium]